jgi:hypothetical protein
MIEGVTQTAAAAAASVARAGRGRLIAARTLTVIGVLILVISVLANFVKRTALDSSSFHSTAQMLVADPTIRDQLALTMVDELYANVDVQTAIADKLPKNLHEARRAPRPEDEVPRIVERPGGAGSAAARARAREALQLRL